MYSLRKRKVKTMENRNLIVIELGRHGDTERPEERIAKLIF